MNLLAETMVNGRVVWNQQKERKLHQGQASPRVRRNSDQVRFVKINQFRS